MTAAQNSRAQFEAAWDAEGQYCRAGGGDYERSFAYWAWQASRAALSAEPVAVPAKVYAFMHTSCVYESAATPISLHSSKSDAWRAMHRHQFSAWEDAQKHGRYWTRREIAKFRSEDPDGWSDWTRKDDFWRKAYVHEEGFIKEFEIHSAAPQPAAQERKPLTDAQISALNLEAWKGSGNVTLKFARAVERAHGITGEKK